MTDIQARPRSLTQALADRRSKGFTLIELMLVLMILAALAVLVVPRITGHGKEAKITTARLGINNIKSALQNFEMNCDRFPTTEEGLQALIQAPGNVPGWKGPYLDQQTIPVDPWQNPYQYRCPGQHNNDYDLYSYGPDGQDGGDDDINNWSLPVPR